MNSYCANLPMILSSWINMIITFFPGGASTVKPSPSSPSIPPYTSCQACWNLILNKRYLVSSSCFSRNIYVPKQMFVIRWKDMEYLVVAEWVEPSVIEVRAAAPAIYWVLIVILGIVLSTVMHLATYRGFPIVSTVKMSFFVPLVILYCRLVWSLRTD